MDGKDDGWQPAVVKQCDGVEVVFRTDYGEVYYVVITENFAKMRLLAPSCKACIFKKLHVALSTPRICFNGTQTFSIGA